MAQTTLDFSAYITDRTRDFTGRKWVFAEIDRWLAQGCYLIITGGPGIDQPFLSSTKRQDK
jgi:hypothetical protein